MYYPLRRPNVKGVPIDYNGIVPGNLESIFWHSYSIEMCAMKFVDNFVRYGLILFSVNFKLQS